MAQQHAERSDIRTVQYARGVIVGKFYPPHRGHQHLIEYAMRQCEHLSVLVCERAGENPSAQLRAAWLREIYPQIEVFVTRDDLPDDPAPWAKRTLQIAGKPDAVFTSEDYGDGYAAELGCEHVQVDRERVAVPCSGSMVRENALGCWEFLHPVVRAHYALRICVLGVESSGTTTLARALAAHYKTPWVPEYGRIYWEGRIAGGDNLEWLESEFDHIAETQSRMEDLLACHANRILICDTDAFTTSLWKERYMGSGLRAPVASVSARRPDLYVLTVPDFPFVQDGYRDGEHLRHAMHERFVDQLNATGRPFVLVSGTPDARLQGAIKAISQLCTRTD